MILDQLAQGLSAEPHSVSGSQIIKLVWLVCCNFKNALVATKYEEISLVDNPLIFVQTNGLNFLCILWPYKWKAFVLGTFSV